MRSNTPALGKVPYLCVSGQAGLCNRGQPLLWDSPHLHPTLGSCAQRRCCHWTLAPRAKVSRSEAPWEQVQKSRNQGMWEGCLGASCAAPPLAMQTRGNAEGKCSSHTYTQPRVTVWWAQAWGVAVPLRTVF